MNAKRFGIFLIAPIILLSMLITGCASSADDQVVTPEPPAPTDIPIPTEVPIPTDTPTPLPEPTTAPIAITTFEDMEGTWLRTIQGRDLTLEIFKNGMVQGTAAYNDVVRMPDTWFEDGVFYIQDNDDIHCSDDQIGVFEVTGVPGEYLVFTRVNDPCGVDRMFKGKWKEASVQ